MNDIKPIKWLKKSEIAKKADAIEAKRQAEKEAESKIEKCKIILDYGVREKGVERDAAPEERAYIESLCK